MHVGAKNRLVGPSGIALGSDLDTTPRAVQTGGYFTSVAGQAAGVQRNGQLASALTVTFANPTTTGNFLLLVVASYGGSGTSTVVVSDNAGNTWSLAATAVTEAGKTRVSIYFCPQATGRSGHQVTITPDAVELLSVFLNEYALAQPSTGGTLDQTSTNTGTSTSTSSGTVTTATAGELYVAALHPDVSGSITPGGGWTNLYTQPNPGTAEAISVLSVGDGASQAAGSQTATWTLQNSGPWAAAVATFKP
jgi:hypothetical protein